MKDFQCDIKYLYDSYNGYCHVACYSFKTKANNKKEAYKKAEKDLKESKLGKLHEITIKEIFIGERNIL